MNTNNNLPANEHIEADIVSRFNETFDFISPDTFGPAHMLFPHEFRCFRLGALAGIKMMRDYIIELIEAERKNETSETRT
jgi:hypothetical protein